MSPMRAPASAHGVRADLQDARDAGHVDDQPAIHRHGLAVIAGAAATDHDRHPPFDRDRQAARQLVHRGRCRDEVAETGRQLAAEDRAVPEEIARALLHDRGRVEGLDAVKRFGEGLPVYVVFAGDGHGPPRLPSARGATSRHQWASAKIIVGRMSPAFVEHLASPLVASRPVEFAARFLKALCHGVARLSSSLGHLSTASPRLTKPTACRTFPITMAPGSSRFSPTGRASERNEPAMPANPEILPDNEQSPHLMACARPSTDAIAARRFPSIARIEK